MSIKIKSLLDEKILKIVQLFLNNPDKIYHLQQISKESKVPTGTTFRIIKQLSKSKIIKIIKVGKLKLYQLDPDTKELEVLK